MLIHRAPGILPGLGGFAEFVKHRVGAALKGNIAAANDCLHMGPFSLLPEPLELLVRVEDQRRIREAARETRTVRVHAHNINSLAREAEGEMWIARVGRHGRVPRVTPGVDLMQLAQLRPQQFFEIDFARVRGIAKDRDEGCKLSRAPRFRILKILKIESKALGTERMSELVVNHCNVGIGIEGGPCTDARECGVSDKGNELLFERRVVGMCLRTVF